MAEEPLDSHLSEDAARKMTAFVYLAKGLFTLLEPYLPTVADQDRAIWESGIHENIKKAIFAARLNANINEELHKIDEQYDGPKGLAICEHGVFECPECEKKKTDQEK